jgi:hypothetical protein
MASGKRPRKAKDRAFDRDATFELDVVGEKDLPHPTGAERGVDTVPAGKQISHRQSDDFFDLVIVS